MTVELTPSGTRGDRMPRPPGPLIGVVDALGAAAYRRFGERMRIAGLPLLLLTTYGAKSGARRRSMLGWLPEGDDSWLIYATAGGAARHPGWYFNLARNPDRVWIDVGKRHVKVRPESLKGVEREAAWRRVVEKSPRYGGYEQKTDRQIPVVRLTALG
jgi:deazaflavin-dependent oxidoreductase (nitroreductase family)